MPRRDPERAAGSGRRFGGHAHGQRRAERSKMVRAARDIDDQFLMRPRHARELGVMHKLKEMIL